MLHLIVAMKASPRLAHWSDEHKRRALDRELHRAIRELVRHPQG